MKRVVIVLLSTLALLGLAIAPANAEGIIWDHNCDSWQNPDDLTSRVHTTAKFDAFDYGGKGNYYVKYKLKWQVHTSTGWKTEDTHTHTGNKVWIDHAGLVIQQPVIDNTGWGKLFDEPWRVWIRATLYKEMGAHPDIRYLRNRLQKSYAKPKFRDYNSICSISV